MGLRSKRQLELPDLGSRVRFLAFPLMENVSCEVDDADDNPAFSADMFCEDDIVKTMHQPACDYAAGMFMI